MNLLLDTWLETDAGRMTVVGALLSAHAPAWGRGDWDAATLQFLIGLLQSVVILDPDLCMSERDWHSLLEQPPTADELERWLIPLTPYFDGPVFEDHDASLDGNTVPITYLFPESAKENTVKKCKDIVQWREMSESKLSEAEARIALYSDAIWGMGIGAGYRQGPRGGSKMTVFVEPNIENASLWQRVWPNVLSLDRWQVAYGKHDWGPEKIFPWSAPCLNSEVAPADAHPLTIYWTMPRRNRLVLDGDGNVYDYQRTNGGPQYIGWKHPLSAYRTSDSGPLPVKILPGHLGYDDWAGLATSTQDSTAPSVVVNEYLQHRVDDDYLRLRCVGWASSIAEATAWIEHTVPLIVDADPDLVLDLLDSADQKRRQLQNCVNRAVRTQGRRGYGSSAGQQLYAQTESTFYSLLRGHSDEDWTRLLKLEARRIFDETVEMFDCDPIEVAKQRKKL